MRRFWMIVLTLAIAAISSRAQQAAPPVDKTQTTAQPAKGKINPPKVIYSVDPHFSDEAREKRINGRCNVSLIVDTAGMPQNIKVDRCSDPSFEESSLDAVAQFRFKPAMTQDGKPVSVMVSIQINYRLSGVNGLSVPVHYRFSSPPGITTSEPGPNGVYPYTQLATPPAMIKFTDEGYGEAAFPAKGNSACDIVLTINAKGKASDPVVTHCERPSLETPAVQSLLKSHFKPGQVNGKAVPMRASIHLELADLSLEYTDYPPENTDIPPEY
ncbi:MAG TPA: energy transducer TonB [Terracidiphilus sp.]|nr:energy transducer TonB [Terracidiphilus sp.]